MFALDYFGRAAFLAQSPQFYKQMMVGVFERVFETGPVFRAEPHDTARHLSEFVSLDAELGFITDHRDVMGVVREAFAGMVAAMSAGAQSALELLAVAAFKFGMPPHGGFAIGLERWIARLVGAANVREVTLFPRDMHRITP